LGDTVRALRVLCAKDRTGRLRALEAAAQTADERSVFPYLAAIYFWEEGEISTAYRFAERCLRTEPENFRMLLIAADYHCQNANATLTREYALRILAAHNPAQKIRRRLKRWTPLLWCLKLIRPRNGVHLYEKEADAFDEWVKWAQSYAEPSGAAPS
jgi:hypothetical protein